MNVPAQVERWRPLAEKFCEIHAILSPNEILSIIWNESGGDPLAQNPGDPSWGLMGVTILIAKAFCGISDSNTLTDPDENVRCGSAFLGYLKMKYAEKFPNYAWVAAYNEGEGNLLKGDCDTDYVEAFRSHLAILDSSSPLQESHGEE